MMLKNKELTIALLLLLLFPTFIYAAEQDADTPVTGPSEPESTEIILPPMYLEIEDLSVDDINAVIPDEDSIYLSAVDMPLPEPGDISIPASVFAVSGPDIPEVQFPDGTAGTSFFSEGTIGAGSSYNITGDINLYRIGEQPDLRLRYYHNGYDGFSGHNPGEGFSYREELIEAEMNYTGDDVSSDVILQYNEIENGLQGLSDYYSMTHRIPEIDADVSWMLLDKLEFTAVVNGSAAGMTLNSSSPIESNVFSLAPEAGLWYGDEKLRVGLDLDYEIEGSFPSASQPGITQAVQLLGVGLGFNGILSEEFRFSLEAGLLWEDWSSLIIPFKAELSGTAFGTLDYAVSGGYRAGKLNYKDLWRDYPLLSAPSDTSVLPGLPLTHGWFGEGELSWNIVDDFGLRSSLAFGNLTDALSPGTSTLTGLGSFSVYDRICLDAGAELFFRASDNFSIIAGWEGQLLEQIDLFRPRHSIYADIEINSDDRNLGFIADSEFRIWDASQSGHVNDWLPAIGLEAYLRFSDGLMLSVSADDLASGLLASGRNYWNAYLDRGLFLQIKTKISL